MSVLLYLGLSRFSRSKWRALAWSSASVIFFWQWGAWSNYGPTTTWIASSVLLAVVLASASRIADNRFLRVGMFAASATLIGTVVVLIGAQVADSRPASVMLTPDAPALLGKPVMRPDILFVVFDAYARQDVLQDVYGYNNEPFLRSLEASGFKVARSANSNYTATHVSVASMLSMAYIEFEDGTIDNSDLKALSRLSTGASPVVSALREDGYRYIHGSGDNWLVGCSEKADICLPGPIIDQTAFTLLTKTPIGPLLYPRSGDSTTHLNLSRLEQLRNWRVEPSVAGESPSFTYLHLVLPHPPLFLDASCNPRVASHLGGQLMGGPGVPQQLLEERKAAYVGQVVCTNSVISDLIGQLDGDEIVVLVSDHGPDSHGSLNSDPSTWTVEQIKERMATLAAIRLPSDCEIGENLQAVNIFRIVLGCIYETDALSLLTPQYWVTTFSGPMIELPDPDELMS